MRRVYSDVLLDHFRNPRNVGSLPAPDISYETFNPLCGDRIRIEIELNGNEIRAARFQGDGCAISLAAASLLTEMIGGSDISDVELFSSEQLLSSLECKIQPARVKCALLPLEALRSGVRRFKEAAREE